MLLQDLRPALEGAARGRRSFSQRASRRAGLWRAQLGRSLTLAWPIAVGMLGEAAMGLVDARLVGALGPRALGGVAMGLVLMYLPYAILFGVMRGVKVRTAYAVGEHRAHDAVAYARAGLALGVVYGVCVWALTRDATAVLRLLRVDPALLEPARSFLAARTWGAPAIGMVSALIQYRQGLGETRTTMVVNLVGNVVNALAAWALIHGRFGLPALGVAGAGYGTALAEAVQLAMLLSLGLRATGATLGVRAALGEVLSVGLPTGLHFGLETLAYTAFTALLASLTAAELAAHQVAFNVIRVSFLPGVALGEAACIQVGHALGRGRLAAADRATRSALVLATGFMVACGVVLALFGGALAGFFTQDAATLAVARRLLLVAAVFQAADAVNIVYRGALRGARDVRYTMLVGATVVWVCVPGAAWLLGHRAGLGALGAWLGFLGETTLGAALMAWRWHRGPWRAKVLAAGPCAAP